MKLRHVALVVGSYFIPAGESPPPPPPEPVNSSYEITYGSNVVDSSENNMAIAVIAGMALVGAYGAYVDNRSEQ